MIHSEIKEQLSEALQGNTPYITKAISPTIL